MRIIVTGGAGFIGSHVADAFVAAGHEVLILDDLSSGKERNIPKSARFEKTNILSPNLENIVASFKPSAICHHAAQISVRNSVQDPINDMRINIEGTLRLLDAARKSGVARFMFASTGGALYGDQETFPAPETHPTYPLSPYGIAKLSAEKYIYFHRKQYGLRGVALRYSNVYGPRQDPHGEAGVVAIFCLKLLKNETPTINGDGKQTRDFVYVGDVAKANLAALEKNIEGEYNIATGTETDVNTLADTLASISGKNISFKHGPPMPGEQLRSVLDPSLAKKVLGWTPETKLKTGLENTYKYFASNPH